jgi:hypothetical protein
MKKSVICTMLAALLFVLLNPGQANAAPSSSCVASATQTVVHPFARGTTLSTQWKVSSPPANTTYAMNGVTSTAYPATVSPFALGTSTPATDVCLIAGTVQGTVDPNQTWNYYHDNWNAACVSITGIGSMKVRDLRCDSLEDGIKPKEAQGNQNVASFLVQGTYLTGIRDDCMENDYTVGGIIRDNLWEQCNTGLSERPSKSNGEWDSPDDETVTVDHTLIGLWQTPHEEKSGVVNGENALFKWSTSANKLVIKCSTFFVDAKSLNGADSMALPEGTTIDDRACPDDPTTIVWTGGGTYPGDLRGLPVRVTSDANVWTSKVASWKAAHGY